MHSFRLTAIALVLFYALYSNVASAQEGFSVWLAGLKQEAIEAGISETTVMDTLNHIELLPNVIQLDHAQPEFISPFLDYYHQRVNAAKVKRGRELLTENELLLNQIEVQYGIPKTLLVAFWGMETNYGRAQGSIDTLSTLATLAYDGRRAGFFRKQLLDAMRIVDAGNAQVDQFRGSWAGAFGNMQFMPTTFVTYAVDGDGDGKIDIVNSTADAFASAANYLSRVGWRKGEPAMIEVQLPENFYWQNAQLTLKKSIDDWLQMGVSVLECTKWTQMPDVIKKTPARKRKSQLRIKAVDTGCGTQPPYNNLAPMMPAVDGRAAILLPQGWRGPAFMVFDNFDVIMDWNRSVNYALSVTQLARRLNQESSILGGQFAEAGALTFQQMFELQAELNERGFNAGEPDGFPGLKTQAAVRAYQLSQNLPADGYASPSLLSNLQSAP